jgi:hypothetical protein
MLAGRHDAGANAPSEQLTRRGSLKRMQARCRRTREAIDALTDGAGERGWIYAQRSN